MRCNLGFAVRSTSFLAILSLTLAAGGCKKDPPSDLTYAADPAVYTKGLAIADNVPTVGGGAVDRWSVAPALPAGLALDAGTGVISGTPTAITAAATYTITAKNDDGSATADVSIAVDARLAVLFTTDEHSHLFAAGPELDDFPTPAPSGNGSLKGGVTRRAAVFATERAAGATRGVDTITVSAGDFSQGTLSEVLYTTSNPDLAAMKLLGYDAIAIGNHEFELGLGAFAASVAAATAPPLVLTNVAFDPGTADDAVAALYGEKGSGKAVTRARVVTTSGGLKVGVVAALGPGAVVGAPLAAPLRFTFDGTTLADPNDKGAAIAAIAAQLQPAIDSLRADDAVELLVLLGHGGIGATGGLPGDDELLAAALRGVDLLVSGHTHRVPDAVRYATDLDARQVPIVQPAPFGSEVGRAELVIHGAGRPELDVASDRTRFIAVDDRTAPSADATLATALATVVGTVEAAFLGPQLSLVTGGTVTNDSGVLGDLYHYVLGHTAFDVIGLARGENDALNLDTDAMLAAASAAYLAAPTPVALQNNGAIRGDLLVGATGHLGFSDVFRVVPNGGDPVEGSPGYPLVRFNLAAAELFAALDKTVQMATLVDADFFLSPGGFTYAYDTSRAPATAGVFWITRMAIVGAGGAETVLFDEGAATPGWQVDPYTTLVPVVTTYFVGSFAEYAGVVPKTDVGEPLALADAILERADTSHVKDYQALATYLFDECAANGGELPGRYDASTVAGQVPRRVACAGPLCAQ